MQMTPSPSSNLPIGSIVMFYGDADHLPSNWDVCDGTNNTPDLRDLFIVGAGKNYNLGNTGGLESVTLTPEEIPPHTHGYQEFRAVNDDWESGGDASPNNSTGGLIPASTASSGGGGPHENRPPFYALFYIMRMS